MAFRMHDLYYEPEAVPNHLPFHTHAAHQVGCRRLWLRNAEEYCRLSLAHERDLRSDLTVEVFTGAAIYEGVDSSVRGPVNYCRELAKLELQQYGIAAFVTGLSSSWWFKLSTFKHEEALP